MNVLYAVDTSAFTPEMVPRFIESLSSISSAFSFKFAFYFLHSPLPSSFAFETWPPSGIEDLAQQFTLNTICSSPSYLGFETVPAVVLFSQCLTTHHTVAGHVFRCDPQNISPLEDFLSKLTLPQHASDEQERLVFSQLSVSMLTVAERVQELPPSTMHIGILWLFSLPTLPSLALVLDLLVKLSIQWNDPNRFFQFIVGQIKPRCDALMWQSLSSQFLEDDDCCFDGNANIPPPRKMVILERSSTVTSNVSSISSRSAGAVGRVFAIPPVSPHVVLRNSSPANIPGSSAKKRPFLNHFVDDVLQKPERTFQHVETHHRPPPKQQLRPARSTSGLKRSNTTILETPVSVKATPSRTARSMQTLFGASGVNKRLFQDM